jgi:hypothetical protein
MRRESIIIGLGILIILLALAGTGSAHSVYGNIGATCSFCHIGFPTPLTANGIFFKDNHKFDGLTEPLTSAASCTNCHTNLTTVFLPLTSNGSFYNSTHRYNDTTLASARLGPPACYNCHVDVNGSNFAFLSGPPTYLRSETCQNCHKLKYDDWQGTMHRVMLTKNSTAQAMGLPTPMGLSWENMSYVIVGKPELRYLNESGYLFKRYFAENKTFADYGPSQYTCGRCHTTGYNASGGNQSGLPGIVGTWAEPGIACERCHGPGGNGHQVEANVSEQVCLQCHNGSTRQGTFMSSAHSPPLEVPTSCLRCHSPFDYAENRTVTSITAINVVCANCHNSHNTSDDQYKQLFSPSGFDNTTYADVKDAKNSFFNSTATRALRTAGEKVKDIYDILMTPALITSGIDASYPGPISVTGPISEVLCSQCHYNHGLGVVGGVNLTHSRKFGPLEGIKNATCVDCHMATSQKSHSFNVKDELNFPSRTCSRGTECHVTSGQNLNQSLHSVVPEVREWRSSRHNDTAFVLEGSPENTSRCAQCHSPINWDPLNASETIAPENFKGVTCAICHNIHDMGDWLTKTEQMFGKALPFAWYKRDAYNRTSFFRANYTIEANTTELCTNCHHNRPDTSVPGLGGRGPHGFVVPHISPQKEMFLGSIKQSSATFNFECATCHMYSKTIDPTNLTEKVLPDSQKVAGHSFRVNETGLQSDGSWNNLTCSVCHAAGSPLGTIGDKIKSVQADIQTKWNATNDTVENAYAIVNASTKDTTQSMNKLAVAFFGLYQVKNDGSWGVHDPQKANNLLNDSARLANEALSALSGITLSITGFAPPSPATNNAGESRIFNITTNQTVNVTWYINGTIVQDTNKSVTEASYTNASAALGTWNVTAAASNENGTVMEMWDWIVTALPPPAKFNISGFKVNDTNGDNIWDSGEMGIENWNIKLLNATTGTQIASTPTDASGFYEFMNLAPGVYNATEEMKAGFTPSGATFRVITIENMDVTDVNFLNHVTVTPTPTPTITPTPTPTPTPTAGSISGFKINDLNGNGRWDADEAGLAGWNIRLIGIVPGTAGINKETTTDDLGFYSFENLPAGMYLVVETLKGGYVPSGSPVLVVNLENGMNSMNNNFTNRPISSLIPFFPATGGGG